MGLFKASLVVSKRRIDQAFRVAGRGKSRGITSTQGARKMFFDEIATGASLLRNPDVRLFAILTFCFIPAHGRCRIFEWNTPG